MMRAPHSMAVAVRKRDGSILVRETPWEPVWAGIPAFRWPFLRGAVMLVESLWNGIQALGFSATEAELDEQEASAGEGEVVDEAKPPETLSKAALAATIALSMVFAFGLFAVLPRFITWGIGLMIGNADLESGTELLFHAVNGVVKLSIFLLYLWGISKMKDIQRVFEYHGAEHKSVFAYEAFADLSVPSAQSYTRFHPRCGTSFLILVLTVSIMVFSLTFPLLPRMAENSILNQLLLVLVELPLMFPIAGVAYELIKLSGKHPGHPVVRAIAAPGLWLQRITTQEPDEAQVEVAMAAMLVALRREVSGETVEEEQRLSIESLADLDLSEAFDERRTANGGAPVAVAS
jgi:uncharacterized protein YqhQ